MISRAALARNPGLESFFAQFLGILGKLVAFLGQARPLGVEVHQAGKLHVHLKPRSQGNARLGPA